MRKLLTTVALLVFTNMATAQPLGVSCNGGYASGTAVEGAPKGETYIVTNRHVVALGGKSILFQGKKYDATLVKVSPTYDLAIIKVQAELPTVKIAASDPTRGTKVHLQGYGVISGGFDLVRHDQISMCRGAELRTPMFISPGDSGSGLLNEKDELAGVIWGCWGQGGGPGVGIPASKVRELIENTNRPPPMLMIMPRYRF